MKLRHIVTLNSGIQEIYNFNNKKASEKALSNAFKLNKAFNTISHILIEPINNPEEWEKIIFKDGKIDEWINSYSEQRKKSNREFNKGKLSYARAIELLKKCMADIEDARWCNNKDVYDAFDYIGFTDDEIQALGFGYVFDYEEEEE